MDTTQMVIYALAGIGVVALLYRVFVSRKVNQPFSGMKTQKRGGDSTAQVGDVNVSDSEGVQVEYKSK